MYSINEGNDILFVLLHKKYFVNIQFFYLISNSIESKKL